MASSGVAKDSAEIEVDFPSPPCHAYDTKIESPCTELIEKRHHYNIVNVAPVDWLSVKSQGSYIVAQTKAMSELSCVIS